jgi:hypothetical protein
VLNVAPLLADAIKRIQLNESVSRPFELGPRRGPVLGGRKNKVFNKVA